MHRSKYCQNSSLYGKGKGIESKHKPKFSNSPIFATRWCKLLIFQTLTICSNRIHSWTYERFHERYREIRISNLVTKTPDYFYLKNKRMYKTCFESLLQRCTRQVYQNDKRSLIHSI